MVRLVSIFLLAFALAFSSPVFATINTTQSAIVVSGNNSNTVFSVPFTADNASAISIIYTNASGVQTTIPQTQYLVTIPPAPVGQLWANSFVITYPITGSPIASGTTLTIQRNLPLVQNTALSNQGNFYPQAVESTFDTTVMQLQQVSARTGQMRGTWLTGATYNFGDVVQDGANGNNTGSYFMCAISNISSTWTNDLAKGDWSLVIQSTLPVASLPLSVGNGGTGQITTSAALAALGGVSFSGTNPFTGNNSFSNSPTVPTAGAGDSSTKAASTAFVNGTALTLANGTTAVTQAFGDNSTKVATTAFVQSAINTPITTALTVSGSGTYVTPPGSVYLHIKMIGGGGGGGGTSSAAGGGSAGGNGGTTSFTGICNANGGSGGGESIGPTRGTGGAGASAASGTCIISLAGSSGQGAPPVDSVQSPGGMGASGIFGMGAGQGGAPNSSGGTGGVNTGAGGGGGANGWNGSSATSGGGTGGGSGSYVEAIITSPSSTYSYTVGAAGAAGTAGTNGQAGGVGGTGIIIVEAY